MKDLGKEFAKQACHAAESGAVLAGILDSLKQNIAVLNSDGVIVMVNRRWREFARNNGGLARCEEVVGENYLELCLAASVVDPASEAMAVHAGIRCVLDGKCPEFSLEYPCHSPEERRWFELHVTPLHGPLVGAVVSHNDITARKLAELSIRDSEERFRAFFEHAMVGMATTSLEKGWLMVNPALCEILGYSKEELVKTTWAELTHPDDLAADVVQFETLLAGSADHYSMEKRFIRPNGEVVHAFIAASAVRRADRSIAFFAATVEDITERKRAEEGMRRSKQLMQQFIDHLPGPAFVKDCDLRVLMANRQFKTMLGLDYKAMIGKTNAELFPSYFSRKLDADDRKVLESGKNTLIEEDFEGSYYETSKFVINTNDGPPLLGGITIDVTERQRYVERQRRQLEINEKAWGLPETEFLTWGLEIVERLTGSKIGFLHFVNDDQESIE